MKASWGSLFLKILISIIAAVASGLLLSAGFPSRDFWLLPWVGLVPLLLVLCNKGPISGFLLALICGSVFFWSTFDWLLEVPGYLYLHHAGLALYLGVYFGIFGLSASFIAQRRGEITALLVAPCLWVCVEFIRSNSSFMAVPWCLLAHSQYACPIVIQISAIAGTYGVSFLVVMVNSAVAGILLLGGQRMGLRGISYRARVGERQVYALTGFAGALLICSVVYGYATVGKVAADETVKISVIQPNIEQGKKWDPKYEKFIMETLRDLTLEASVRKPALIVWPETATPRSILENYGLFLQVQETATKAGAPILLGSAERQKHEKKSVQERKSLNSAFLIHPRGVKTKVQKYDKIQLFPFGEYLPKEEILPWARIKVPKMGGYVPGKEYTIFELGNLRFCTTICWESIFPNVVRPFLERGADLIINIANEAWFGKTAAPYQFLAMNVFRAVEHRVSVVRCANTGVSCVIDPSGRVTGRVQNDSKDIFVKGFLTSEVPIYRKRTIYTSVGDVLIYVSAVISLLILASGFVKVRRK